MLQGEKVLVAGATGQVALPLTLALAGDNDVWATASGWPAIHVDMILGGVPIPVHVDAPSIYNPIHEDDVITMVPALLAAASVPATVVNWAGEDAVSIEDWCAYLGELTGLEPTFRPTDRTIASVAVDLTRMHDLVGHAKVPWQEGFARMVAARRVSTAGRGRT